MENQKKLLEQLENDGWGSSAQPFVDFLQNINPNCVDEYPLCSSLFYRFITIVYLNWKKKEFDEFGIEKEKRPFPGESEVLAELLRQGLDNWNYIENMDAAHYLHDKFIRGLQLLEMYDSEKGKKKDFSHSNIITD